MRRFVKREAGKIVGMSKWPHAEFPEEIDDRNAEFIQYETDKNTPPVGPDIPDTAELWEMLKAKGTLKDSDRKKK